MSLLNQIRADSLKARKLKFNAAATLLVTLLSEAEMVGKNAGNRESTDSEVMAVVRKFIANNAEAIARLPDTDARKAVLMAENETLGVYLPKQMSEQALRGAIDALVLSFPGAKMGDLMKHLKAAHDGCYDGKLASTLLKEALK